MRTTNRMPALALLGAGVALAAYPALRGYAVEDGASAAELYARPAWLVAHALGMLGFALVAVGLAAVDRRAHHWMLAGTALLLPYYGAEAYGLHAVGRRVAETGDTAVLAAGDGAADLFRYEPVAVTTFALGWVLLAAVGVRLAVLAVRRGVPVAESWAGRAGLLLAAAALTTYLPVFFATPTARVGHGVLGAGGLLLVAVVLLRQAEPSTTVHGLRRSPGSLPREGRVAS